MVQPRYGPHARGDCARDYRFSTRPTQQRRAVRFPLSFRVVGRMMCCARLLLLCLVLGAVACGEDDAGFQISVPTRTPTPTPEPCGASSFGAPCTAVVDATPVPGYCTIQFVHFIGTPQYVPTPQYTCLPFATPCPGGSCTIEICVLYLDGTAIPCPTPTPTPPFVRRSHLTPCSVGNEDG